MKKVGLILLAFGIFFSQLLYAPPPPPGGIPVTVYPHDVAPVAVKPGQTGVAMVRFYLLAPAGASATWDQITVTRSGTGSADTDVSSVRVYRSVDTIFDGGDTQIGSGTFTGGSVTINVTDQAVTDSITYYYFIVYDISGVASTSANIGVRLNADAFIFVSPDYISGDNLPFESTESDIGVGGSTMGSISVVKNDCDTMTVTFTFTGDDNFNSTTQFEYNTTNTWPGTVACSVVSGVSPRTCRITGLNLTANSYYVRVTQTDPDGVTGTNPLVSAQIASGCGTSFVPVVNILAPLNGGRVAGNATYPYKIQASVWEPEDVNPLANANVQVSIDGGAWTSMTRNANYDDVGSRFYVYEYNWVPGSIGVHRIAVRAVDSGGNAGYAQPNVYVYVNDISASVNVAGEVFKGEGNLLVRTNSAQVCNDCHDLPSHGSAGMNSTSYGSWQLNCRDCHSPHVGGNIYLVNSTINTPNSGVKAVTFQSLNNFVDNAAPRDGVCEVCHTKTKYYRNDGSQPQAHNKDTQNCTGCHPHNRAFAPSESGGGSSCCSCHSDLWSQMNSTNNYHHYMNNCEVTNVASSGTKYPSDRQPGGTTDEDRRCLMCHVDHDIFRPDINPGATRSANLRTSVGEQPNATTDVGFVNTDYGYTKGTATFTNGSTTVTGSGTNWQSNMVGWYIRSDNYDMWYQVSAVVSSTQLTLATAYAGPTYTGGYLTVSQDNISTVRAYKAGRATFTQNSATVTGVGTKWLDYIRPGWLILPLAGPNTTWLTVSAVNSDTQLTLSANYSSTTVSNVMYIATSGLYTTGTVSVTNNSNTVTGSGTTWLNTVQPGWKFRVNTNGNWYTVASVSSNTSLTLTTPYFGPTATGQAYTLYAGGSPTANFTNGSTTVTGNGTSWSSVMNGWYIKNDATGVWYLISNVNSATQLTLSSPYTGPTMSGASFTSLPPSPSGICGSCHYNTQLKSYSQPDGTTQTPLINITDFRTSSHEYKVSSTFGADSSTYYANCSKCHNDTLDPKSSFNAQTSTYKFGNHQSILRRILAPLGILSPTDPLEEQFCYQCHTGGTAGNDYYGVASMTAQARSIQRQFTELWGTVTSAAGNTLTDTTKNWTANAFENAYVRITGGTGAGQTRLISGNTANTLTVSQNWTTTPNNTSTYEIGSVHSIHKTATTRHRPVEGQSANWNPANDRHVQCEDCHNPHTSVRGGSEEREPEAGGTNRGTWGVVPTYTTIYNTGTASFTNGSTTVTGTGTSWTSAMVGQWIRCFETATGQTDYLGRWYKITAVASATSLTISQPYEAPRNSSNTPVNMTNCRYAIAGVTYQRVEEAGRQAEVCFKCHSDYAYDDLPANIPDFPALNANFGGGRDEFEAKPGTNVALEFNPNLLGFHPVMGPGNNRPPAGTNPNWSTSAGRKRIPGTANTYNDLSNTFVDGWEFTSIVTCNDCHESRSSGDPQGPHGSANQWILKGVDRSVTVTIADGNVVSLNDTTNIPDGWVSEHYFCYNCHRWDVYNIGTNSTTSPPYYRNLSRINHPPDGRTDTYDTGPSSGDAHVAWGIGCMHCHGGDSPGGMHGSNRGQGEGTTPQGRRLLNGATWTGITAGGATTQPTCFTIDNTDTRFRRLSICTDHTGGRTGGNRFNYTYP